MSQFKVVELNVEGNKTTTLPPIVHTIRQQSKKQLNELLQNLFNNTDDALFELADRSQSDQHQEMYFDSMRLIRLHRKTIASTFMRGFYDDFTQAFSNTPVRPDSEDEDLDDDSEESEFTLLGKDELEMDVAVAGIVSKVTSQYSLAVMQLTKRLDYLAKTRTITERTNPLGPHALSTTFANALDSLDVNIKIRIILMKLYERFVMERLGPIYETANRALIDADVLADLKNKPPRRAKARIRNDANDNNVAASNSATTVSGITTGPGMGLSAGYDFEGADIGFNAVQSLLAGVRDPEVDGGTNFMPNQLSHSGKSNSSNLVMLPTLDSGELIQALNRLQTSTTVDNIDIEHVPELGDVRTLVLSQTGAEKKSLGQADDDTVNFVGMLFDYILNDRNLAIPMKALISRLQIPIVKLAILDKTFFEKSAHPARALLNELSSAGIGWSGTQELKRDALYNKIESIVLRVLNEFADNPDVFSELLDELRLFVSKDSRRTVLVEQRVKESEEGKAKTQGAKLQVQNLVNQKACGLRLPSEAGKFISEVWSRVLTMRMVKHGESSPSWTGGVETLDDLLWTLQPLSDLDAVDERDARTPQLLENIHDGMAELGATPEEIRHFQTWLSTHLQNISANDRAFLEDDERPELNVPEELVEEIVLTSAVDEVDDRALSSKCQAVLKVITEGTWVEIKTEDDRTLRCKLATITQPGFNYIFVNRRGMKVLEQTRKQIADLLDQKKLKLIDESQVFDRALQSVIGNLRQLQRERVK